MKYDQPRRSQLATLANLGVDWSRTTHQNDHQKGTETMPRYEAYLGANKPETLAAGEGEADAKYGVVRQSYATGETRWVGGFAHYGSAMGAVNAQTTHLGFGIMCLLRPEPEKPRAAQEYTFTNGIPVLTPREKTEVYAMAYGASARKAFEAGAAQGA